MDPTDPDLDTDPDSDTDPDPQRCLVDLAGKLLVRDGNTACLQEGLGARVEPALLTQDICQGTRCTIK